MSNRFSKYTSDKLRIDGWLDKEQATTLRTRLQQVESERDRLKESVLEFENREASVCPENTPFEQVIKSLRIERDKAEADAAVMRGLLAKSKDAINEVAAFGNCDCDIPKGHKCVPCECGELFNEISAELITHDAGKSLLERLKEAEWLVQNLVATDTFAATRRDTFLNPKPQDVKP